MRLQKYLSLTGVASRREAERLMVAGRVRVNGRVVTTLGSRVDPETDRVEVDGAPVEPGEPRWIAFHKPVGVLTTRQDTHGRETVYDRLPHDLAGLRYVGRLDLDTSGLLLFTNRGEVAHRLQHPSGEVEREYEAEVARVPSEATLRRLHAGVLLEDGPARARRAVVREARGEGALVRLVLTEGRKREVRRLLAAVGHPPESLRRIRFGPIRLGDLPEGSWRDLTQNEIQTLNERAGP